ALLARRRRYRSADATGAACADEREKPRAARCAYRQRNTGCARLQLCGWGRGKALLTAHLRGIHAGYKGENEARRVGLITARRWQALAGRMYRTSKGSAPKRMRSQL